MARRRKRRPLLGDIEYLRFGGPGEPQAPSTGPIPKYKGPRESGPPSVSVPYAPTRRGKEAEEAARGNTPSGTRSLGSSPSSPSLPPPIEDIQAPLVSNLLNPLGAIQTGVQGVKSALEDLRDTKELDRRTLGSPSLEEILRAGANDQLRINKAGKITTPRIRKQVRSLRAPIPGLDREQTNVLTQVLTEGVRSGADYEDLLAGTETGLVESNLRNLGYGDADSEGWRQERTSIYGTGPQGPRNVKASARRFFEELETDAGTQSASTPGLKAQAAQGSAFPERYDEQEAIAKPLLNEYLRRAKTAKRLGLPLPGVGKVGRRVPRGQREPSGSIPSAVWFGKKAESPRFGLEVRENPYFDPVDPVHTEGSHHYQEYAPGRGEAIDVVGDPADLARFNRWAARKFGKGLTELFYDPGVNIADGTETEPIGGHDTHVHLAVDEPGASFKGGYNSGTSGIGSQAAALVASGAPVGQVSEAVKAANEPMPIPLSPIDAPFGAGPVLPKDLEEVDESGGPSSGPNQGELLLDLLSQAYAGQGGSLLSRRGRRR